MRRQLLPEADRSVFKPTIRLGPDFAAGFGHPTQYVCPEPQVRGIVHRS
jgi:hypothetical protein